MNGINCTVGARRRTTTEATKEHQKSKLTAEAADSAEETAEKIMPCYKSSRKILFVHGQITRPRFLIRVHLRKFVANVFPWC